MTHPVRVASRPVLTKRKALMISCASAAIAAVALAPQQARAQVAPAQGAFRGNMTVSAGTASQLRLTDSTETITIGSPTATINWSPTDVNGTGNVDFLPQGNVATFVNDPQLTSDYTVLNRIIPNDPARAIELNGHVLSQIQSGAGTSTGGKVWFYSPGGIVVGATAVFDVGGLLLSTIDLPNLFSADASGFSASFAKTQTTAGSIQVLNGAQINALQQNSYVALVAPRIVQGGNVQVNGSAAYAAGDQVSMTMNQGLFDIAIDVGTDDPEGIVHSGTTGGPASADNVGDPHRIYMVAVPKNQALTMLLGGSVGFDSATSASVENGAIVLSAGLSINENSTGIYVTHSSGTVAGIDIGAGSYTSRVEGYAKGDIEALADAGSIDFAGDVTLRSVSAGATGNIILAADYGYSLMIAGDATLYTSASTFASIIEAGVDGGTLTIDGNANFTAGQAVDGTAGSIYLHAYDYDTGEGILQGTLTVAGATYMYTNVGAASVNPDLPSADNVGGNVTLDAAGGTMTFADVTVNSSANGQDNLGNGDGSAGDGRGGNINFTAWSGGSITVDGSLNATADGYGGNMYDGGTLGGEGRGGDVHLNAYDGSIDITGDVTLSSLGIGGDYFGTGTPFAAQGGAGYGGNPSIWLDGPGSITVDGVINFYAAGTGGNGQTGGAGRGGIAGITSYDGSITLGPTINIDAAGVGGHASEGFGGNGGLGDGGTAYIEARGHEIDVEVPEATTSSITGGDATINANGIGGSGGASNGDNVAAGAGGEGRGGLYTGEDGTGGAFAASANGSSIVLGDVELSADGFGGDGGAGSGIVGGGAGGAAFGGSTEIGNYGPVGDPSGATYQNVIMYSGAFGGDGGTGGTGQGVGGEATAGGYVFDAGTQQNWGGALIDTLGTVTMGTAELYADATGGAGSIGGDAIGGIAQAASWQDTSSDLNLLGALTLDSGASGGDGVTGGSATGGYSGFGALTGARIDAALVTLKASATGGSGQSAGGVATGGSIEILSDGGIMNASNIVSEANAAGGDSLNGAGGNAAGDGGVLTASNGGEIHVIDRISMSADATGGNGGTIGGTATGGTLTTTVGGTITAGTLDQSVAGTGGDGSAGGDGTGGAIELLYGESGGSLALTGDWIFGESFEGGYGTGGDGTDGNGGTGTGATIDINVGPGGELDFATLWTFGMGLGGDSVSGIGGAGVGGTSTMTIASGGSVTGDEIYLFADAGGGISVSGTGGSSDAGTALLSVDGGSLTVSGYTLVTADSGAGSGADGGNANGGDATFEILANGGTVTGGTVQVSSQAIGGTGGATGTGGNGDGGTALFTIADALNAEANAAVTADITVIATGRGGGGAYGGSGSGGSTTAALGSGTTTGGIDALATGTGGAGSTDGGGGYGGEATITVGGNLVADHITAGAAGIGGAGTNGYGGEAWGSFARVEATGAGSIQATGGTIVNANGTGGAGMLGGGYGQGADASIWAIDGGSLVLGTSTTVSAVGTGGSSTNGTGGDGYGGYARVRAFDGSSITANALTVDTSGVGGNGVDGGTGQGGFDGEGSGGAHADSSGDLAGLTLTGLTTVKSNGSGGNATSGIGGSGYGGTADLGAQLGGDTV
ncbi:MAG TPA: hypothetical protein VFP53_03855, partial [Sphingomicrobium sp.]|nr:hypothetical protein [Sphingomicrobium sp.]